jgi:hypothetical protein
MALIPQQAVYEWIQDVHRDGDSKTGYLVKQPTGVYGKKVKELVRYAGSLSVELKAIRQSRQLRVHPCLQYFATVFQFLSEFVFPVTFASLASYAYYQWTPEENDPPLEEVHSSTNGTSADGILDWIPSSTAAGQWVGGTLRSIVTVPVNFVFNAVDRGVHAQEALDYVQSTGFKMLLLPLLFLVVYFLVKLASKLIGNLQHLCASHNRVWQLQELLLTETEEALERAVSKLLKPALLSQYEQMLSIPSQSPTNPLMVQDAESIRALITVYRENPPLLRESILDRLSAEIKATPFAELVRIGNLSPTYTKTIHALIRHADEELSETMFAFHKELHHLPETIQTRAAHVGSQVLSGATRIVGGGMLLGGY